MNNLSPRERKITGWVLVILFGTLALCNGILAVASIINIVGG